MDLRCDGERDLDARGACGGPILADLVENTVVGDIPLNELYEDNAPHGRPNIYLLAAMITFKEMFRVVS